MRILIAEDSRTQAVDLSRRLQALGHEVVVSGTGLQAWDLLKSRPEPLLISDWMMPEMNGLELCRKIRSELDAPYVYIILLTAKSHRHERLQGLNAGADDFLTKPIDSCELEIALKTAQRIITAQQALQARAKELERTNEELALFAATDQQTGLKNQRGFDEAWTAAVARAKADFLPLALIRIELDHRDQTALEPDPSLSRELIDGVANRLREVSRDCDTAARISGHGFALILPGLSGESALRIAYTLQESIRSGPGERFGGTASLGVASMTPGLYPADPASFLRIVESALAEARQQGGDRIVESESPVSLFCAT